MKVHRWSLYFCLTICFSLVMQTLKAEDFPPSDLTNSSSSQSPQIPSNVRSIARAITVKVAVGNLWGSGIIVKHQNNVYTILTNAHVAGLGKSYKIQAPDGRVYPGRLQRTDNLDGEDLAALTFSSSDGYQVANLAIPNRYNPDSSVFASGFPAKSRYFSGSDLIVTDGKIATLLPQSLKGGYQLGYTNDIYKGMSGGPLLNQSGEVIAVNGKHKFPLWGNTYIFQDGSTPSPMSRRRMDYLSWGIPTLSVSQKLPQLVNARVSTQEDAEARLGENRRNAFSDSSLLSDETSQNLTELNNEGDSNPIEQLFESGGRPRSQQLLNRARPRRAW